MASRILPSERIPVPLPPAGFRKIIPLRIRYLVLIRQRGLDPDDAKPLDPLREGIDFDHRPPLHARIWDAEAEDTIPPANDPAHIFARRRHAHEAATAEDLRIEAKVRRLRQTEEEHRLAVASRPCGAKRLKLKWRAWRRRSKQDATPGDQTVPVSTGGDDGAGN